MISPNPPNTVEGEQMSEGLKKPAGYRARPMLVGPTEKAWIFRTVAAYLLDRADQYETESPCWIALTDAAHNVTAGEADAACDSGELDASLYERLDRMTGGSRRVDPKLGVEK